MPSYSWANITKLKSLNVYLTALSHKALSNHSSGRGRGRVANNNVVLRVASKYCSVTPANSLRSRGMFVVSP